MGHYALMSTYPSVTGCVSQLRNALSGGMTGLRSKLPQRIFNFNQYYRDQWVISQAADIPPNARVLDVGAGSTPYRAVLAHTGYVTHDFSRLAPEQLVGNQGYGNIDIVSDICSIPVPESSFDVIVCTEVLEHVPLPIDALHEFARILKPGGKLLLSAPLGSGLHQQPHHYYGGFTPWWYRRFLAEAGFTDIHIEANGGFFKHYGQESWRFAFLLAPWRGKGQIWWLPIWVVLLPWLTVINPLLAHFLDALDDEKSFTVGYHVTALRAV